GNLTPGTLNGLFLNNLFPEGRLEGDFRAKILRDQLTGSEAYGRFEGKDLIFPMKLKEPLLIRKISVYATENEFRVNSGDLTWGDRDISLAGSAVTSGASVTLDMDISTERVEWENLKNVLESDEEADKEIEEREEKYTGAEWNFPLRGVLRFKTEAFEIEGYTWSPLQADITFARDGVNVAVKEGV
ncbi:MAG: hypothetical protein GTO08_04990, partial [Deltaproteobacteria bacterium]|nr:hypothetical protein [Deltaproteobacteria bacterium]